MQAEFQRISQTIYIVITRCEKASACILTYIDLENRVREFLISAFTKK